jgi:hypothetical protein
MHFKADAVQNRCSLKQIQFNAAAPVIRTGAAAFLHRNEKAWGAGKEHCRTNKSGRSTLQT